MNLPNDPSHLHERSQPSAAHPREQAVSRSNLRNVGWSCAGLLGFAFFWVYAAMLPDQPTRANFGGDGGDFVAAMLTGGVPHPTGYPLYILLGRLFLMLPVSTPYYRVALLSAVAGALAVALFFRWMWKLPGDDRTGWPWLAEVSAGAALGGSPIFWSQAVIVEVHALQAVFVLAWLAWMSLLLSWRSRAVPASVLVVYGLLGGISLGNHLTVLLLLPALGACQVAALRRGMPPRLLLVQGAAAALGGLVYAYLPLAARGWPPVNWGNPQTWQGFWWLVSAEPYQGLVFTASAGQWLLRAAAWVEQMLAQFGLTGLVLGAIGLVRWPRTAADARLLLIWMFGIYSVFAIGYNTPDAQAYLIPALLAFAAWIGYGLIVLWPMAWRGWPVGRALVLAALLVMAGRLATTRAAVDPRAAPDQASFASALLADAPRGAFIITSGDEDSFPLWYYHFGLGQRPDVRVVVQPLTQFRWYQETLQYTYPDMRTPPLAGRGDGGWADLLVDLNPARPVCRSNASPDEPALAVFHCLEGKP